MGYRRFRFTAVAAALTLIMSACTATGSEDVVTVTQRVDSSAQAGEPVAAPTSQPGIIVVGPVDEQPAAGNPAPGSDETPDPTPTAATAPSTTEPAEPPPPPPPPPMPLPVIGVVPQNGAKNVDPRTRISVAASGGHVTAVRVLNPDGKQVGGTPTGAFKKASWTWDSELGFGRIYRVEVTSVNAEGASAVTETTFTTIDPKIKVVGSVFPSRGTWGIGQPVVVRFSAPVDVAKRREVEKMITVKTAPVQKGAFRWFSNTEVHWRPKVFWKSGTKVSVSLNIYARPLSAHGFGVEDRAASFTIGRAMHSTVDARKFQLKVFKSGKLIRTIPVSLGTTKYPTYNGIHIVTEKHKTKIMDSSTWGLKGAGAYRTKVKWATRISNSGEFVHGAPWSVGAQGNRNVSHGCINMTDEAAKWFQQMSLPGDPLTVTGSTGKTLSPYDGYGDWNIPFAKY